MTVVLVMVVVDSLRVGKRASRSLLLCGGSSINAELLAAEDTGCDADSVETTAIKDSESFAGLSEHVMIAQCSNFSERKSHTRNTTQLTAGGAAVGYGFRRLLLVSHPRKSAEPHQR